jgi:hypothetical protein
MRAWARAFVLPPGGTERRIEARLLRQEVLQRTPPVEISAVIDEAVLRRRIGTPDVMREQLERVITISEWPGSEVRVLPPSGEHVVPTGAFNYFKFRQIHDVPLDDLVTFDHLSGTSYAEREDENYLYAIAFEVLHRSALDQIESRGLMRSVISEWKYEQRRIIYRQIPRP